MSKVLCARRCLSCEAWWRTRGPFVRLEVAMPRLPIAIVRVVVMYESEAIWYFHQFYLNNNVRGILYILFCWTLIPPMISIIDIIILAIMSEDSFNNKYNQGYNWEIWSHKRLLRMQICKGRNIVRKRTQCKLQKTIHGNV